MNVIDLCDYDDDDASESNSNSNQSSTLTQSAAPAAAFIKISDSPPNEVPAPHKPMLKLISIEKLKETTVTTAEPPKKTSRRKSVLLPKAHDSDSIQFLDESSPTEQQEIIIDADLDPDVDTSVLAGQSLMNLDDAPNPNMELMHQVAFLRVSIQHTLKELGLPQLKFDRSSSWGGLRAQYIQNKLNAGKRRTDSHWCDERRRPEC